jgi:hypothetical protein
MGGFAVSKGIMVEGGVAKILEPSSEEFLYAGAPGRSIDALGDDVSGISLFGVDQDRRSTPQAITDNLSVGAD